MADTVPVYGDQKVLEAPLPNVHFNVEAPLDAFGGGAASQGVFGAIKGIGEEASQIALEERKKADQLAFLSADKQLSELETSLQVDSSKMLGKDAFGAPDYVGKNWKEGVDDVISGLANDQQKNAVLRSATSRWESLNKNVQLHVRDQSVKLDDEQTKGYIDTSRNAAVLNAMDDDRLSLEKMRQEAAVTDWANRNGIPINSDAAKAKKAQVLSETYRAVISQRLTLDQDQKAQELFDNVKDQMTADDINAVSKALEAGSLRGDSQRASDEILAKHGDNRAAAMEDIKNIDDPKLRDAVEQRVDHGIAQIKQAKAEAKDQLVQKAANLIDKNPGKLPSDLLTDEEWSSLSPHEKNALNNYFDQNAPNNDKLYLKFIGLGDQIGKLSQGELITDYLSEFDRSHKDKAMSMWASAHEGKDPDLKLTNTLNFHQQVSDALELAHIINLKNPRKDWTDDQVRTLVQFETNAAKQVEIFERTQLQGKRHASPTEVQSIIDKMVKDQVFVKDGGFWSGAFGGSWFSSGGSQKPIATIREDQHGSVYVPYDKIPEGDINSIKNFARTKGYKVDRDNISRAYGAYKIGASKQEIDDILGGRK